MPTASKFESFAFELGFNLRRYGPYKREPEWWGERLEVRLQCREVLRQKSPYATWMLQNLLHNPLSALVPNKRIAAVRKVSRRQVLDAASSIPALPTQDWSRPTRQSRFLSHDYDWSLPPCGEEILISVKFTAPDDAISSQVLSLVELVRQQVGIEKRRKTGHKGVTIEEMAPWETSGLLPYLDLRLAADLYSQAVSESTMTRLLFPDAKGDTDRLNTAQAQAGKVFKPQFIRLLRAQGELPRRGASSE
jgi:hypothetical protein